MSRRLSIVNLRSPERISGGSDGQAKTHPYRDDPKGVPSACQLGSLLGSCAKPPLLHAPLVCLLATRYAVPYSTRSHTPVLVTPDAELLRPSGRSSRDGIRLFRVWEQPLRGLSSTGCPVSVRLGRGSPAGLPYGAARADPKSPGDQFLLAFILALPPLKVFTDLEEIGVCPSASSFVSPLFVADRAPRRGSKDASPTHAAPSGRPKAA